MTWPTSHVHAAWAARWTALLAIVVSGHVTAQQQSQTFGCGFWTFTVPTGVTSLAVEAHGGSGVAGESNSSGGSGGAGGSGGLVVAKVPVLPGSVLSLPVACAGFMDGGGAVLCQGYGNGGYGGNGSSGIVNAGQGGCATALLLGSNGDPLVVAGGGGGGGAAPNGYVDETSGGGAGGSGGNPAADGQGGQGVTGGAGGCGGCNTGHIDGLPGYEGEFGAGPGGGGGAGYPSGGGGGFILAGGGGGGGGGLSWATPAATSVRYGQSPLTGDGKLVLTWNPQPPPSPPSPPPAPPAPPAGWSTQAFSCGDFGQFAVPPDVTRLWMQARGESGAPGVDWLGAQGGYGGYGAAVTGTAAVTPGQILYIWVACRAQETGWSVGGTGTAFSSGGQGGGSSAVVTNIPLIVAAGGGGGGAGGSTGVSGYGGNGGNGGLPAQAGSSGVPGSQAGAGGCGGCTGSASGGDGTTIYNSGTAAGGGGGGGWSGGQGGAGPGNLPGGAGGGGGGSSYAASNVSNVVYGGNPTAVNGLVILAWEPPSPPPPPPPPPVPPAPPDPPAGTTTQAFGCGTSTFSIPPGTGFVWVQAHGAKGTQGGSNPDGTPGGYGGYGAAVTATLPVTSGQALSINVACGSTGFDLGGHGAGGGDTYAGYGGDGGGSSAVYLSGNDGTTPLVVAGGGGGGGGGGQAPAGGIGGNGGNASTPPLAGQAGLPAGSAGSGGCGGCSATGAAWGSAGAASGGGGGGGGLPGTSSGGGGSGGTTGGAGGGGGGASFAAPTAVNVAYGTSPLKGDGKVVIAYTQVPATWTFRFDPTKCSVPTGDGVTCTPAQFQVPFGISQLTAVVRGAPGGQPDDDVQIPGGGALVVGTLNVTPGEILTIWPGQNGNGGPGVNGGWGFGCGGKAGNSPSSPSKNGGAGGGGSAIYRGAWQTATICGDDATLPGINDTAIAVIAGGGGGGGGQGYGQHGPQTGLPYSIIGGPGGGGYEAVGGNSPGGGMQGGCGGSSDFNTCPPSNGYNGQPGVNLGSIALGSGGGGGGGGGFPGGGGGQGNNSSTNGGAGGGGGGSTWNDVVGTLFTDGGYAGYADALGNETANGIVILTTQAVSVYGAGISTLYVPSGATQMHVSASGATGGPAWQGQASYCVALGGPGGRVDVTVPISGSVGSYQVDVGAFGGRYGGDGFESGGGGGEGSGINCVGGGGGGATGLYTTGEFWYLTAGGGGGGGGIGLVQQNIRGSTINNYFLGGAGGAGCAGNGAGGEGGASGGVGGFSPLHGQGEQGSNDDDGLDQSGGGGGGGGGEAFGGSGGDDGGFGNGGGGGGGAGACLVSTSLANPAFSVSDLVGDGQVVVVYDAAEDSAVPLTVTSASASGRAGGYKKSLHIEAQAQLDRDVDLRGAKLTFTHMLVEDGRQRDLFRDASGQNVRPITLVRPGRGNGSDSRAVFRSFGTAGPQFVVQLDKTVGVNAALPLPSSTAGSGLLQISIRVERASIERARSCSVPSRERYRTRLRFRLETSQGATYFDAPIDWACGSDAFLPARSGGSQSLR